MRPMTSENRRKKTRRPNGTGSEWKDAKGVWHARKQTDPDPRTGRRRWIEAQAPTKTAARQKLEAKIDQRRRQGTLPLTDVPTVDLYLDRWLHQTANRVKPRVLDTYRSECNAIRGVIGGMRLDRITPETIEAMCDELATTRSGKTVHNIYIRTKQILTHAVRDKLIPINPALAAIPPRYEPADTIILQPGQPAAAIHAAHDPKPRKRDTLHDDQDDHDMWALMFDLAFATGMRQAERFAITPSELVTRDGIHGIEVRWQLQQLKPDATIPGWLQARHITGNFWLIPPKTRQGIRFIPLDTRTWLRLLELANKHQCAPDDLIFTRHGQPLTGNVERHRWQRALQDAGLPPVTMRAARHFFSTHLAQTGAPEDARKAIMGHAKITTTARYTHWTPETLAALADEAREAIGVGKE